MGGLHLPLGWFAFSARGIPTTPQHTDFPILHLLISAFLGKCLGPIPDLQNSPFRQ